MTIAAVGSPIHTSSATVSVTPHAVGNYILFEVLCNSSSVTAVSMASTNATWAVLAGPTHGVHQTSWSGTIFIGKATSASTATATITFSSTTPTVNATGHEFSTTAGTLSLVAAAMLDNSGGTNTWPSLTPLAAGNMYFGYAFDGGTASAGSTSGYTYSVDANDNGMAYNVSTGTGATGPVWGDSFQGYGLMAILQETSSVAAIAPVQKIGTTTGNGTNPVKITPAVATTATNAIIAYCCFYPTSGTGGSYPTAAISDSAGNTYTVLFSVTGSATLGPSVLVAVAYNATSVASGGSNFVECTFTGGSAVFSILIAEEYSGLGGTQDGSNLTATATGATINFGTLSTSNANDLVLTVIGSFGNLSPTKWTAGWANQFQSASPTLSVARETAVAAGSFSGTATLAASEIYQSVMIALEGTSSGVPGTATITGAGTVSAPAIIGAGASLTGAGAVTAPAVLGAGASLSGAGTVTAAATQRATASITGAGTVSAPAVQGAGLSIAGAGSLTSAAVQGAGVSLAGSGSVSAPAVQGAGLSIAGAGAVSAPAVQGAGATLTGAGSVAAPGVQGAGTTIAGAGSVAAAGIQGAGLSVQGAGSVSSPARQGSGCHASGAGSVTVAAAIGSGVAAAGAGSLTAAAVQGAGASIAGAGAVTQTSSGAGASLAGAGAVTIAAVQGAGTSLAGAGLVLAPAGTGASVALTAAGTVQAGAILAAILAAAGHGSVTAGGIQGAGAALAGSGSVTAAGTVPSGPAQPGTITITNLLAANVTIANLLAANVTATVPGAGNVTVNSLLAGGVRISDLLAGTITVTSP